MAIFSCFHPFNFYATDCTPLFGTVPNSITLVFRNVVRLQGDFFLLRFGTETDFSVRHSYERYLVTLGSGFLCISMHPTCEGSVRLSARITIQMLVR